jgi:queuine tRNA-ribosyltransferase
VRSGEMLGPIALTRHNLTYYQGLMAGLRAAIEAGDLTAFASKFRRQQAEGDLPAL